MQAHFPPFTRTDTAARAEPVAPVGQISDTESKLRTLKHYLYHAGILLDELLAADSHIAPQLDSFTRDRDRDATGA